MAAQRNVDGEFIGTGAAGCGLGVGVGYGLTDTVRASGQPVRAGQTQLPTLGADNDLSDYLPGSSADSSGIDILRICHFRSGGHPAEALAKGPGQNGLAAKPKPQ